MKRRRNIGWAVATVAVAGTLLAVQELPEGDGKKLIADRCGSCHSLEQAVSPRMGRDEWRALVDRMIKNGAALDQKQSEAAVDYLAGHFGPPPRAVDAATERTARRFIEGICASCHTSDLIKGTQGTKEEWRDIVQRMNGKGAGLSEPDVELLADYLAKTYAAKPK